MRKLSETMVLDAVGYLRRASLSQLKPEAHPYLDTLLAKGLIAKSEVYVITPAGRAALSARTEDKDA